MAILPGDTVTIEYTGRLPDGTVFDTTREEVAEETGMAERQPDRSFEPLTMTVAADEVIIGLDATLVGMDEGQETTVEIPPDRAYGERDEDLVREYDVDVFDEMMGGTEPEPGMVVETQEGEMGTITEVAEEYVEVDFNHELAGRTLTFDVEVLEVE